MIFLFTFLTLTYLSTSFCLIDQFCASAVDGRRRSSTPSRTAPRQSVSSPAVPTPSWTDGATGISLVVIRFTLASYGDQTGPKHSSFSRNFVSEYRDQRPNRDGESQKFLRYGFHSILVMIYGGTACTGKFCRLQGVRAAALLCGTYKTCTLYHTSVNLLQVFSLPSTGNCPPTGIAPSAQG